MIPIRRLPAPEVLTEKNAEWTADFLAKRAGEAGLRPNKRRYAHRDVFDVLAAMSHYKCFYCEQSIKPPANAEVDHHVEVAERPDLAFAWENLYLACSDCNRRKLTNKQIPTTACVDPCDPAVNPLDHLSFNDELVVTRDGSSRGAETIRKYRLDRPDLDGLRAKELKWLHKAALAIDARMIADGRKVRQPAEDELLRSFAQSDHPFSHMLRVALEGLLRASSPPPPESA